MTGRQSGSKPSRDLVAEYTLGILTGDDLLSARRLQRDDPEFRQAVARLSGRLAPMLDEVEQVTPPRSIWVEIAARVGTEEPASNVIELRRKVKQWRGIAAAMSALAACLAIVLVTPWSRSGPETRAIHRSDAAPLVAMLGDPSAGTRVVASWDPGAEQLVLAVPGDLRSDQSHSHELWVIPKDGKPRSLGTLPKTKQMHMRLAEALARLLEQGATIAISVEPRGGSPTGAPTGPVVASGALTQA